METIIKILIVEHDANDIDLLHYELKKGGMNYVSEIVQNEEEYINALKNFIPDIILCDYSLPAFDGSTAFQLREQLAPNAPFIFVSGIIREESSIEYIKRGVTDYALKDRLFTLTTKVRRALTEAKEKLQKDKTEQERILSEKRLARTQELAHIGNWELDFAINEVSWCEETCRIYGIAPGQNMHSLETWLSFTHPADLDLFTKKIKEARYSLRNFSFYYRIVRKNKSIRHVYSEGKLEFAANGKATGIYGITHDVTEKILLENKLVHERLTRQREITDAVLTALENERAEIGKELHDNLGQILALAKLYIQMAQTYQEKREMYLEKSCGFIMDVIEEIRKIAKTLVIPGTHGIGLLDNIKHLVHDLSIVHPLKIEFHDDGKEGRLNEKLQLTILRIVQEQLNNILKHSKATQATIDLSRQDNQIVLLIADNGEGYDILKDKNGVGIINIKSRAELYRGKVTIVSKPGEGYKLKVELPLNSHINRAKIPKAIPKS